LIALTGPLVFGADEPTTTGYCVWAACPCGAAWERWVSVAEVVADLDPADFGPSSSPRS
jgi:hypothetical protein